MSCFINASLVIMMFCGSFSGWVDPPRMASLKYCDPFFSEKDISPLGYIFPLRVSITTARCVAYEPHRIIGHDAGRYDSRRS